MAKKLIMFFVLCMMLTHGGNSYAAVRYSYDGDDFISLEKACADIGIGAEYNGSEIKLGDTVVYVNKYHAFKNGEKCIVSRPVEVIDGEVKIPNETLYKLFGICYEYSYAEFDYVKSEKTFEQLKAMPVPRGGINEREKFAEENLTEVVLCDFEKGTDKFELYGGAWSAASADGGKLYRNEASRAIIKYSDIGLKDYIVNVKALGKNVGVIGRATDDKNYYEAVYMNGTIYLNKYSNGVKTVLAKHPFIWNEKNPVDIKLKFDITEISVYFNDELRIRYNDISSPLLSGSGGISGAGETYFDDFRCYSYK